ncbi:PP2C family protein-serine/threonine phosphatase [Terriglobus aquaticus]|uniref:PP2C family protein-serine/threonine phosphatase n=2 Tax=Terriglobus aquaticus TaxID=940139 RepID=A0ABW9KH37_9BACT
MLASLETRYSMLTDVGRVRANNEDACGANPETGSYVVCDGMGGAAGGEIASRETAASFLAELKQRFSGEISAHDLEQAVSAANRTVYGMSTRDRRLRGMGTTLVALQTVPQRGSVWVTHVGDSRCYRIRAGSIERLTGDHSVVEEQIRNGEITEAEARRSHLRNVITRVVGSQREVAPECAEHPCRSGDLLLLCTDGLNRDLSDADILSIVERHRHNLDHAARVLVDAANLLGGGDNITVLLLEVVRCGDPAAEHNGTRGEDHDGSKLSGNADRVTRMSSILRTHGSGT